MDFTGNLGLACRIIFITSSCFQKTPDGVVDIINGLEHPNLKKWQGETDIGTLFAGGFLE